MAEDEEPSLKVIIIGVILLNAAFAIPLFAGHFFLIGGGGQETGFDTTPVEEEPLDSKVIKYEELSEEKQTNFRKGKANSKFFKKAFLSDEPIEAEYILLDGKYYEISRGPDSQYISPQERQDVITNAYVTISPVLTIGVVLFFGFTMVCLIPIVLLYSAQLLTAPVYFTLRKAISQTDIPESTQLKATAQRIIWVLLILGLAMGGVFHGFIIENETERGYELSTHPVPQSTADTVYEYRELSEGMQGAVDNSIESSVVRPANDASFSKFKYSSSLYRYSGPEPPLLIKSDGEYYLLQETTVKSPEFNFDAIAYYLILLFGVLGLTVNNYEVGRIGTRLHEYTPS